MKKFSMSYRKNKGNILYCLILFTVLLITACTKDEKGDDPEDFFSMKSTVISPIPSFNLNDFSIKEDDGFLLAGNVTNTISQGYRGAVINLKPDGGTVWTSDFAVDTFLYTMASFAVQQKNGLTLVAGMCNNTWEHVSRFVAILGKDGRIMDHKLFPVPARYGAAYNRIIPRSDGYFFLVSSYSPYDWNIPDLLEVDLLDADCNLISDKIFEGVYANADQVTLSSSDGLIIAGTFKEGINGNPPDFLLIQTDKDGKEILHTVFGSYSNWEYGNYCIEEDGGGLLFSGTTSQSSACTLYRINRAGEVSGPVYVEKYDMYTDRNYILKTQAPGYMVMSYTRSYFVFMRLNADFSVKWTTSQVIRSPSQGNGTWSSCHFVPAGNGRFAFAYLSDDNILLFKTRSY